MDARRFGSLVRAVRVRKGLRQEDVAALAGVGRSSVSRVEAGHVDRMTVGDVERIASAVDVRVDLVGRWHGGDGERLLNWRHSLLAESVRQTISAVSGWAVEAEVSFSIYGERGVIDQLAWHAAREHLLVVQLKTEFVDFNELLGTVDRHLRLAPRIAAERGWRPGTVSFWLIVTDTRTNRRHAARHASLLRGRFPLDGRSLRSFLTDPTEATFGMAFWTDVHSENGKNGTTRNLTRVRPRKSLLGQPGDRG